jgi:hypothetical protein
MITRALIDFIQKERSLGTSKDDIVALLREKGWSPTDIGGAFAALVDMPAPEVPRPAVGLCPEFCSMLLLMWSVYRTRWQRFFGIGLAYLIVVLSVALSLFVFSVSAIKQAVWLLHSGADPFFAFQVLFPYLLLAAAAFVVVQAWYLGTLYVTAMKKGESIFERALEGIRRIPGIIAIKMVVALLLLISFTPVLLVSFLTQNPLVFVVFGPLFIMGAVLLGALLSLSIPAYFHGTPWRESALRSIRIVSAQPKVILGFYMMFILALLVVAWIIRGSGPVTLLLTVGFVTPMETLFMIAMYRRFETQAEDPQDESPAPVAIISNKVIEVKEAENPLPKVRTRTRTRRPKV